MELAVGDLLLDLGRCMPRLLVLVEALDKSSDVLRFPAVILRSGARPVVGHGIHPHFGRRTRTGLPASLASADHLVLDYIQVWGAHLLSLDFIFQTSQNIPCNKWHLPSPVDIQQLVGPKPRDAVPMTSLENSLVRGLKPNSPVFARIRTSAKNMMVVK